MPIIRVDFDRKKIPNKDVLILCRGAQKVIAAIAHTKDVSVYANCSEIAVGIAPIEMFIQMSETKIKDVDVLTKEIKERLSKWKKKNRFKYKINVTVIPMSWKIEIGI